jgi:hypothetical protein
MLSAAGLDLLGARFARLEAPALRVTITTRSACEVLGREELNELEVMLGRGSIELPNPVVVGDC